MASEMIKTASFSQWPMAELNADRTMEKFVLIAPGATSEIPGQSLTLSARVWVCVCMCECVLW